MKKQKITDTISVAEMLHMRNVEGMSNKEIAQRIGCAISTVIDHIGRQPREMTLKARSAGMRKFKHEEPSTPVGEPAKPHESFADLVARVKAEAAIEKNKKELGIGCMDDKRKELFNLEQSIPTLVGDDKREAIVKAHQLVEDIKQHETPPEAEAVKPAEQAKPEPLMAPTTTPYTTYKEQTEKPTSHIHELLAIFGADAVRNYLRVALYVNGNVHISYMEHDELLSALKTLNGEVAAHD